MACGRRDKVFTLGTPLGLVAVRRNPVPLYAFQGYASVRVMKGPGLLFGCRTGKPLESKSNDDNQKY
jgi:hypothetical protein